MTEERGEAGKGPGLGDKGRERASLSARGHGVRDWNEPSLSDDDHHMNEAIVLLEHGCQCTMIALYDPYDPGRHCLWPPPLPHHFILYCL